jgi:uncharacterized surface anchored protein
MSTAVRNLVRRKRSRTAAVVMAVIAVIAASLAVLPSALASHGDVSLTGSNFEIDTDANLKVDHAAPSIDWASVNETRKADQPSGQNDDSFGQGTKEDTPVPTVVDGSIPPEKSDLLNFGVYFETTPTGRFLNVFWHRVQEPNGTTNMDFEFNQSKTLSSNGVTPVRTAGDVLIQYDLAQGGTNPQLFLSRWIDGTGGTTAAQCQASNKLPCWNSRINLSAAGDATGSINTSAIPAAESDGLGPISPRTFGEASIDFDALVGGTTGCVGFGSAYLKSRSSDSFTAALKDFIAPEGVDISRCGTIRVLKKDDAGTPLNGAVFNLLKDNAPVGTAPGVEDTLVDDCTTGPPDFPAGECSFTNVLQGEYWVVEITAPPGHDLPSPAFQHATVVADETVTVNFVNPRQRGAIVITKTRKHAAAGTGDHPHPGVVFTVAGQSVTTDANGQACVDGLLIGTYAVTETVPAGYAPVGPTSQNVTVDNPADCTAGRANAEQVSFANLPLTNLTVSVDSQIVGGTSSTINCDGNSAGPGEDISLSAPNLPPGTYTCTIEIDP